MAKQCHTAEFTRETENLPAATVAKLLGISLRQLNNYVNEGMPTKGFGTKRRFVWRRVWAWWRAKTKQAPTKPGALTLGAAQARKYRADAQRTELKLARERGQLVPVEDVKQARIKVNAIIRARLLAIPGKLTPMLASNGKQAEVKSVLEREIREVLTELSKTAGEL
jgi:phage terminase Nu1 subunit (DNA packaging protein)